MLDPAKTPIDPGKVSGSTPALSSASQQHSRNRRCCGSVISASRGLKSKNGASKLSTSSSGAPAATKLGSARSAADAEPASSADVNGRIDSTPARKLDQKAARSAAPGKRPDIPVTAMENSFESDSFMGSARLQVLFLCLP